MLRQVALDTETTGLSPQEGHRIIEIGLIEIINRKITGNSYHQFFNPGREVDLGAVEVHGITREQLADKPRFSTCIETLLAFIDDAEVLIHNAPFDVGFLNHEFRIARQNLKTFDHYCQVLDTLPLARQLYPGQRNSLDALCKRHYIDNTHRVLHGALLDAELLARVYLAMTGGQASLQLETKNANVLQTRDDYKSTKQALSLPVIMADEAALTEHRAILQKLTNNNQQATLWDVCEETT